MAHSKHCYGEYITYRFGTIFSEKSALENVRRSLNEQIEALNNENERLQAANADLQRERDNLEDGQLDQEKDMERQKNEITRR